MSMTAKRIVVELSEADQPTTTSEPEECVAGMWTSAFYVPCAPGHFVITEGRHEEPARMLSIIAWRIDGDDRPWPVTYSQKRSGPDRLMHMWSGSPVQFPDGHLEHGFKRWDSLDAYHSERRRKADELLKESARDRAADGQHHRNDTPSTTGDGD